MKIFLLCLSQYEPKEIRLAAEAMAKFMGLEVLQEAMLSYLHSEKKRNNNE